MLAEAVEIIRALHTGDLITYRGDHFDVDSARIWDVPDIPVELAVAVAGDRAIEHFAPLADHLVAVEPDAGLIESWNAVDGRAADRAQRRQGHRAGPDLLGPGREDRGDAGARAVPLVRGRVERERRPADPAGFAAASQYVRPEDVAESIPCGPTWTGSSTP